MNREDREQFLKLALCVTRMADDGISSVTIRWSKRKGLGVDMHGDVGRLAHAVSRADELEPVEARKILDDW